MNDAYGDLLKRRRPVHIGDGFSRRHPQMSRLNRAKLFAPFAALSGFDAAIRAREVPYVARKTLTPETQAALNRTLNRLHGRAGEVIRVEYFEECRDPRSPACGRLGLYHSMTGAAGKIDSAAGTLAVGALTLRFEDISAITDPAGWPLYEEDEYDEAD